MNLFYKIQEYDAFTIPYEFVIYHFFRIRVSEKCELLYIFIVNLFYRIKDNDAITNSCEFVIYHFFCIRVSVKINRK